MRQNEKRHLKLWFQTYSDVIYRLCLHKTGNKGIAEQLAQETFLQVGKQLSVHNIPEKPKEYLYQVARNLIKKYYASRKPFSLDLLQEEGLVIPSRTLSPEQVEEVILARELLQKIDKQFQEVFIMRILQGMRVRDIAEKLNISQNLVSVRIIRAKQKIRKLVNH